MKDSTLRILMPLLESDETVTRRQRDRAVEILCEGGPRPDPGRAPAPPPGYLRRKQAAAYLGIAPRTLTDWMNAHVVPYIKVGHLTLFRPRDLDAALDRFRYKAVGER